MKEVVAVSLKPVTEASSLGKSASDGGRLLVQVTRDKNGQPSPSYFWCDGGG